MTAPVPEIICFTKTYCGWCQGIRKLLRQNSLPFLEKDLMKNPAYAWELEQKSGQRVTPTVIINGDVLSGVNSDDVLSYLTDNKHV